MNRRPRQWDLDNPRNNQNYQRRPQKRSRDEFEDPAAREQERMKRIKQLLVRIGEKSSSSLAHNLDQLSKPLLVDIAHYRQFILATLFECVTHLSVKVPIYATLVGLINVVQQDFGEEVVQKCASELECALMGDFSGDGSPQSNPPLHLTAGKSEEAESTYGAPEFMGKTIIERPALRSPIDLNRIRLLVRFVACLFNTNVIRGEDFAQLLHIFVKHVLTVDSIVPTLKDHIAYIMIRALFTAGEAMAQGCPDDLSKIMADLSDYMEQRPNKNKNEMGLQSIKNISMDIVDDMWSELSRIYRVHSKATAAAEKASEPDSPKETTTGDEAAPASEETDSKEKTDDNGEVEGEGETTTPSADVTTDSTADAPMSENASAETSVNASADASVDASADASADTSAETSTNASPQASADASADASPKAAAENNADIKTETSTHASADETPANASDPTPPSVPTPESVPDESASNKTEPKKAEDDDSNDPGVVASPWLIQSLLTPYREFSRLKKSASHSLTLTFFPDWRGVDLKLNPVWVEFGVPELLSVSVTRDIRKKVATVEQLIVTEYIHDIFEYFSGDSLACADQLMHLPAQFQSHFLVMESLFTHMLLLPTPVHLHIFYGKVIMELFRKQAKVWPRVLGPIVNKLLHEINTLDVECRDRLAEWFAFHLNNFRFQWPWGNWDFVADQIPESPQRSFVNAVMRKCVTIGFYDDFAKSLPLTIKPVLPVKPEPVFRYMPATTDFDTVEMKTDRVEEAESPAVAESQSNTPATVAPKPMDEIESDAATHLVRILSQRQSMEDITTHLDATIIPYPKSKDSDPEVPPTLIPLAEITSMPQVDEIIRYGLSDTRQVQVRELEMLITCILHVGKSSCSHVISQLRMYGSAIKKMMTCPYSQLKIVAAILTYWQNSGLRCEILCDKLHAQRYVSPSALIKYLFLPHNLHQLHTIVQWKILMNCLDRVVKTASGVERNIKKCEMALEDFNKQMLSDFANPEAIDAKRVERQRDLDKFIARRETDRKQIRAIFSLLFSEFRRVLHTLHEKVHSKKEAAAVIVEDDTEMDDDDMLMTENYFEKKEEQKNKIVVVPAVSRDKYILNCVLSRLTQIARRYRSDIAPCRDELDKEVFNVAMGCEPVIRQAFLDAAELTFV